MTISIMQPYFFPYLGYFSLIKHTDQFILLDIVQFIRHGWIDRNRILKQSEGWIYIQVPIVKAQGRKTLIKDIRIDNQQNWRQKILAQLQPYKKMAPNYFKIIRLLNEVFNDEYTDIVSLNKISLQKVCDYLGIKTHIDIFSEMGLDIRHPNAPDEWALNICTALGDVDEYWNTPGGIAFFDKTKFSKAGVELRFQKLHMIPYDQRRETFELGLSIIDVMMFNTVDDIQRLLDNYELS